MFDAVGAANTAIDAGERERAASLLATIAELTSALGLEIERPGAGADTEIDGLVAARDAARAAKNFAEADRIRDELAGRGIVLEDTPNGTIWRRS